MLINNRFRIEKEIGRGGVGVAYRAVDVKNGAAPVVIKVLLEHPDEMTRGWIDRHFRKEGEALARINHPGVAQYIDSGITEDGKPFLAMEFIEGCGLRSQIDPSRGLAGDFERVAHIMRGLGSAISAAHDKGVYHRDLKPENIILQTPRSPDEEEQVKVIDFGIATVKDSYDEKTKTTLLLAGSKLYMAPEQIENKPTAASDIYAMGVMAYEMLTGRTPFTPDLNEPIAGMVQLMKMQSEGVRVKPKDLRPSLPLKAQEIVLKALSYKAGDRPARAEDFGNELAEALLNTDEPSSPHEEKRKKAMRLWLIFLIATAATAAVVVWLTNNGGSAPNPPNPQNPILPERVITYWGEIRKYRGNKPIGDPTRLSGGTAGEVYFRFEDSLRFYIKSADDGCLYLLNEDVGTKKAAPRYTILFPTAEANGGSSKVIAQRQTATSELEFFDKKSETEKVWMIWSVKQISELEDAIRRWVNEKDRGIITDAAETETLSKLIEKHSGSKLNIEPDSTNERMRLKGRSEVMIYGIKLKRR